MTTYIVNANGQGDFLTIQDACDRAHNGDKIKIQGLFSLDVPIETRGKRLEFQGDGSVIAAAPEKRGLDAIHFSESPR